ncbi:MAG: glycosyltransferase family 39 protein [Clostridiales bacterium]|nr:glycosyltransferase family 39 protein [Clostridiales bacterium]
MSKGKNKNKSKSKEKIQIAGEKGVQEKPVVAESKSVTETPAKKSETNLYMDPDMEVVDSRGKTLKISSAKAKKDIPPFLEKIKPYFPLSFIIAFVFDLIYGIIYYNSFEAVALFDTSSYFEAAGRIMEGRVDLLRTPVYPLFLHFCENIGGENVNQVAVAFQIIVFYISIWFFYMLLKEFTSNHVMLTTGTILYGCMTAYINFNFMMLTESFSVSALIVFCYFLVKFIKTGKFWCLTTCFIMSFFMTMLRPGAVYLYVVDVLAVIPTVIKVIKEKNIRQKKFIAPTVSLIVCVIALFGYMSMNKDDNNYFGLSYVSEMNKFYDVVQADIYHDNSDTEIVAKLDELTGGGPGTLGAAIDAEVFFRDMESDPERISDFNREAIDIHTKDYCYYLIKKVWTMGYNHMEYNLSNDSYYLKEGVSNKILWIGDLLDFNVNYVYFVVLLSAVFIFAMAIDKKRLLFSEIMITAIIAGQLAVNILAGPAEFHRLNATLYPLAILLIIAWAGLAYDKVKESKPAEKSSDK